jgi:hypothetical protein
MIKQRLKSQIDLTSFEIIDEQAIKNQIEIILCDWADAPWDYYLVEIVSLIKRLVFVKAKGKGYIFKKL